MRLLSRVNPYALRAVGIALACLDLFLILALLGGCASSGPDGPRPASPAATRADTILTAADLPSVGKMVFRGPVTIQTGGGNTSTTVGKDKTGKGAQAVSTGDGSPIKASEKKGGVPWWVFLLVGVASVVGWEWLTHQVPPLKWLPWRARVG